MARVTLSPKFQLVVPRHVRESLRLRPGQKMEVFEYDGRIEFMPVRNMKSMRGFLRGIDTYVGREKDRV